jgi:Sigma-70, region 4.
MKENWYAFFMATQREISVEQALKRMGIKTGYSINDKKKETKRMVNLKSKGYSYREIARMYGMNYSTVRWRIIRAERKRLVV